MAAQNGSWGSVPVVCFSPHRGGLWEAAQVHSAGDAAQQPGPCHPAAQGSGHRQRAQVPLPLGESQRLSPFLGLRRDQWQPTESFSIALLVWRALSPVRQQNVSLGAHSANNVRDRLGTAIYIPEFDGKIVEKSGKSSKYKLWGTVEL